VDGKDGFFYGIPSSARRVVKFNPLDKSLTEIGPDLGEGGNKWLCGVRANNSSSSIHRWLPLKGSIRTLGGSKHCWKP
jgi:hypothetical protein